MSGVVDIMEAAIPLVGCISVFGIPISIFYFKHQVNMRKLELETMAQRGLNNTPEIEAMKAEIRNLRETTMQYDIAFDTALQNMDRRVNQLEVDRRSSASEQYAKQQNGRAQN